MKKIYEEEKHENEFYEFMKTRDEKTIIIKDEGIFKEGKNIKFHMTTCEDHLPSFKKN